jgi:hypothetical protein
MNTEQTNIILDACQMAFNKSNFKEAVELRNALSELSMLLKRHNYHEQAAEIASEICEMNLDLEFTHRDGKPSELFNILNENLNPNNQ